MMVISPDACPRQSANVRVTLAEDPSWRTPGYDRGCPGRTWFSARAGTHRAIPYVFPDVAQPPVGCGVVRPPVGRSVSPQVPELRFSCTPASPCVMVSGGTSGAERDRK